MGRKNLDFSSRRMNSRLNGIAIISQNGNRVGLFDYTIITQLNFYNNYERIHWIRKKHLPYIHYSQTHANMRRITLHNNSHEMIRCVSNDHMAMDNYGRLYQNQIYGAQLTKLPYSVNFGDSSYNYPVYTLMPDFFLPWDSTLVDMVTPLSYRHPARRLSVTATCPITFETLNPSTAYWTPCGHAFSIAIAQALENDARCPLCRATCTFNDCISAVSE